MMTVLAGEAIIIVSLALLAVLVHDCARAAWAQAAATNAMGERMLAMIDKLDALEKDIAAIPRMHGIDAK